MVVLVKSTTKMFCHTHVDVHNNISDVHPLHKIDWNRNVWRAVVIKHGLYTSPTWPSDIRVHMFTKTVHHEYRYYNFMYIFYTITWKGKIIAQVIFRPIFCSTYVITYRLKFIQLYSVRILLKLMLLWYILPIHFMKIFFFHIYNISLNG